MESIIRQKLADAVSFELPLPTRREAHVPPVPRKAHAIIGMRRAGKTWFLYQCMQDRLESGWPRDSLVYFNFEDERWVGMTASHLSWLLEEYFRRFPERRDRSPVVLLLDEIQVVQGWETFVRRILDSEAVEVYVSGSSARMLSRELATSLRGRSTETIVYPYNFREFLRARGTDVPDDPSFVPKRIVSILERDFDDYLFIGGFPEAQGLEERDRFALLQGYVDAVIFRDVVERHNVTNLPALRRLVRQVLGSPAGRFSVHRIYNDLHSQGVAVSKQTLHELLSYLEDAFLLLSAPLATSSERRRQSNPRKLYPLDPGMVAAFDRSGKPNRGARLETIVALEVARLADEWGYHTTSGGLEVDFHARMQDGSAWLIQVASDLSDPDTRERELRALLEAMSEVPEARGLLLTMTGQEGIASPESVTVTPVWRWLLDSRQGGT